MTSYDLYGCKMPLSQAKTILENALGVTFEARESVYQGGEYFRFGNVSVEHFELKTNADPFDGEALEVTFADYPSLFYVNATNRSAELCDSICRFSQGFVLLRHEEYPA